MKTRNTIVMLVVLVGLFAYLKWWDPKFEGTDAKAEKKGKPVQIDRDSVTSVTIRNSEGSLQLTKAPDGNWLIETPVKDRADSLAISTLFTSLESLRMDAIPAGKGGALADYGLTKGDVSIKVNGKTPVELLIGKETAVEGKVYMRVEGKDTAYVAAKDLCDQTSKGVKEWRDHRLSDLTATQVSKVAVKTAKGEFEVEKTSNHWSLTRPFKGRADDQKLADLISNATTPRIEEFVTDAKDLGAFGLGEPRATVTFHAEGVKEPVVLQIGNAKKSDKPAEKKEGETKEPGTPPAPTFVYVKLSTRDGVFSVPAAIESLLTAQPNDLRDQNIMRVQTDMVDRITLEAPGREKIILSRSGEEWVRKIDKQADKPVNGGAANRLLSDLTTMKVSRFVADVAGDLKQYGLDAPVATVTLSSYSTEGTPETKPGDRPLAKLMFGKFEGDAGYAKLDDEPFIVAVPASLLEGMWTDPLQWQELKVQELKGEDVAGFEVTRSGQPALAFDRDKDRKWKLAKGEGTVSQGAAESLVNTLANLRAVRWAGATNAAAQGLDKPNVTVTFTLADKKTGRISVGKNTPEELWNATLDGKTGTFLLNKPDFDALNASLIETPKPAAAAGAPNTPSTTVTTPPIAVPAVASPVADAPPVPARPKLITSPADEPKPKP
ncbi:MAG: DUF4340 domain-containing protein [Chthoniobacteraceae bacterium]